MDGCLCQSSNIILYNSLAVIILVSGFIIIRKCLIFTFFIVNDERCITKILTHNHISTDWYVS